MSFHCKPVRKEFLADKVTQKQTVDLMKLAGIRPFGVCCELTNPDGTMARLPEVIAYAKQHEMPVLTIADLVSYRLTEETTTPAPFNEAAA